jgi:hypothetical protein
MIDPQDEAEFKTRCDALAATLEGLARNANLR